MNDVLPRGYEDRADPGLTVSVSGSAVLTGVLVAYGAFALLISIVAAFANGAHSHQVLSAATWKQLGTGGGIVTGIVLFIAWAAGGLVAARTAGRDGVRHGVWVFIVGVVLITVVGAAITWLPDTTAILRNLRLLGLPVRRNEWRDIGSAAGLSSIIGMAAGAIFGGWLALRTAAVRPAATPVPAPAPAAAPAPIVGADEEEEEEVVPEPAFVGPSLFEEPAHEAEAAPEEEIEAPPPPPPPGPPPEPFRRPEPPTPPTPPAPTPEPGPRETPAWLQFVEERERSFRERELESPVDEPAMESEPAPAFIEPDEQYEPEPAPAEGTSFWPGGGEETAEPVPAADDAWALPDDDEAPAAAERVEGAAFPHPPPTPVPDPQVVDVAPPPPEEHAEWDDEGSLFQAPPEPAEDELQQAPEAPAPEVSPEEAEERRRQQEEAARAYEQAREREQ